jgi:hypothetical protein
MIPNRTVLAALPFAIAIAVSIAVAGAAAPAAQSRRPDFSGTWQVDSERSKELTERKGHEWRVAGAGSGGSGGASQPGGPARGPLTVISQSDSELVIERTFDNEILDRTVLKLDGSVSVNARRSESSRSTTVWKGNALVTTGTSHFDFSDVRTAAGTPVGEVTRDFVTTRTLMPDGTMQVENRTTQDGKERVSWSVLVRVKS